MLILVALFSLLVAVFAYVFAPPGEQFATEFLLSAAVGPFLGDDARPARGRRRRVQRRQRRARVGLAEATLVAAALPR